MRMRYYANLLKSAVKPWKAGKYLSRIMPELVAQDASITLSACQAAGIKSIEIDYLDNYTILIESSSGIIAKDIINTGNFSFDLCKIASNISKSHEVLFVNIGANMGTTCLNAYKCGFKSFIAFEPVEENYRLLKYNLERNISEGKIKLKKVALGREDGTATIHLHNNNCGRHSLKPEFNRRESIASTQIIEVQTLDAQNIHEECFIWLDTEGFELEVLEGASETLKNCVGLCVEITPSVYTIEDLKKLEKILMKNFKKFYSNKGENIPIPSSSEPWVKGLQHDLICVR